MTTKFLDSFLVAGIGDELVPDGVKKNFLCGIRDIAFVQGNIPALKEVLGKAPLADSRLKWIRYMTLSNELDLHLAIQYANPFKADDRLALYDLELVRCASRQPIEEVKPTKGCLIHTCQVAAVSSVDDIFEYSLADQSSEKGEFSTINNLVLDTKGYDFYLAKDVQMKVDSNPINEIHLHCIPSEAVSIKMPAGYKMAFSTLLHLDGQNHYLIKRLSTDCVILGNDPSTFSYCAEILSCYPILSEGAAINSLKLLFPNGCKISPQKRNPIHQSCYITVDDSSLDQCMLTFIKYSEKTSDQFAENVTPSDAVLQLQFQGFQGTVCGEGHWVHFSTPRQQVNRRLAELYLLLLTVILGAGAYRSSQPLTKRMISHMVDHLVVSNDSTTVYRPLPLENGAVLVPEVRIFSTPKLPNLPVGSLKRLFRVLCLDSIIPVFKNLLLGRGIYIIGRNPRTAFDIIESLTSLLYPLKWEHPRILSYESKYEIFESPIPLIYYFDSEKFDHGVIANLDLADKCLLFADSNGVREFCSIPGTKELPTKPLTNLQKSLTKVVGTYSSFFAGKRGSMTFSDFDKMLENPDDSVPFDYWRIRECFFEFMNELLNGYQDCYRESQILSGDLVSSDSGTVFDFAKFLKLRSGLKNPQFFDVFSKASLFSRFVECRIHPETVAQEEYYNYFDKIQKEKAEHIKFECFSKFADQIASKPFKYSDQPSSNGLDSSLTYSYSGRMPVLNHELFIEPRVEQGIRSGMALDEEEELNAEELLVKINDEKWAKKNIEILFTVWFLSLKVFMKQPVNSQYLNLVNFAYDKIIEMEADKYTPSIDVIKSAAFILGIFREGSKVTRIIGKFRKVIEQTNQLAAVYAEYVQGCQVHILPADLMTKQVKYKSSGPEHEMYTQAQLNCITIKELDEDERDESIPIAIKSYFETNTFCSTCQTYIPEEIILAKMKRNPRSTQAVCPNQACSSVYEPVFSCLFLKQKGSRRAQESVKLLSPLNLLLELKEFLQVNDPRSIMDVVLTSLSTRFQGSYIGTSFSMETS